jgi:hypothetical protein
MTVIVDLFLSLLFGILDAVFGLLPDFQITTVYTADMECNSYGSCGWDTAGWVARWLVTADLFLPVGVFFWGLVTVFAARAFVAGVQLLRWLWDVLPLKSS